MTKHQPVVSDPLNPKIFKGGHLTINSGGLGPDSYLFRRLPRKPWVRVEIRYKEGKELYQKDLDALSLIFKYLAVRVDVGTLKRTFQSTFGIQTMNASEFFEKYGGD